MYEYRDGFVQCYQLMIEDAETIKPSLSATLTQTIAMPGLTATALPSALTLIPPPFHTTQVSPPHTSSKSQTRGAHHHAPPHTTDRGYALGARTALGAGQLQRHAPAHQSGLWHSGKEHTTHARNTSLSEFELLTGDRAQIEIGQQIEAYWWVTSRHLLPHMGDMIWTLGPHGLQVRVVCVPACLRACYR